jgi:hypothetical protein
MQKSRSQPLLGMPNHSQASLHLQQIFTGTSILCHPTQTGFAEARSHIPVPLRHTTNFLYLYLPVSVILLSFCLETVLDIKLIYFFSTFISTYHFLSRLSLRIHCSRLTILTSRNRSNNHNGAHSRPRHKPLFHPAHPRTLRLQRPRIRDSCERCNSYTKCNIVTPPAP